MNGFTRLDLDRRPMTPLEAQPVLVRWHQTSPFEYLFAGQLGDFRNEIRLVDAVFVAVCVRNFLPRQHIFFDVDDIENDSPVPAIDDDFFGYHYYFFGLFAHDELLSLSIHARDSQRPEFVPSCFANTGGTPPGTAQPFEHDRLVEAAVQRQLDRRFISNQGLDANLALVYRSCWNYMMETMRESR
jgi:hypothetical protein